PMPKITSRLLRNGFPWKKRHGKSPEGQNASKGPLILVSANRLGCFGVRYPLEVPVKALAMSTFLIVMLAATSASVQLAQTSGLPAQLSDQEFWSMVTTVSEPSGRYTGDNWVSNEASIQDIIPHLRKLAKQNGAYIGVGPEQNFTYMWAMQSKMGFIIDIRRQNMLEILMLKSLFELSPDRADFVANLFSRRRPAGLDANTSAQALMTAFASAPSEGLAKNVEAVKSNFTKHGYTLSAQDVARIAFIQDIFNRAGLSIVAEFESPSAATAGGAIPVPFTRMMTA